MAAINFIPVSNTDTPNTGRATWNTAIQDLNTSLTDAVDKISGSKVVSVNDGTVVTTAKTQTLSKKTIMSKNAGGDNTVKVSRLDLDASALFNIQTLASDGVTSKGVVGDIIVSNSGLYQLKVQGSNGISTSVVSGVMQIQGDKDFILNNPNQKFGVGLPMVSATYLGEIAGDFRTNGMMICTSSAPLGPEDFHISSSVATAIIESTDTNSPKATLQLANGGDYFSVVGDFKNTPILKIQSPTQTLVTLTDDLFNVNVPFNLNSVVISGGLSVTGTFSGTVKYINLERASAKQILMGDLTGATTGQIKAVDVSGDITTSGVSKLGEFKISTHAVQAKHLYPLASGYIFFGNGLGSDLLTGSVYGDMALYVISGHATTVLQDGVIKNKHISSNPADKIDSSKLALTTSADLQIVDNKLSLTKDISGVSPAGTIIAYAGRVSDTGGLVEPVTGWLLCNGADMSKDMTKCGKLITLLNNDYGNLSLPDLRGYFLRGLDTSGKTRDKGPRYNPANSNQSDNQVGGVQNEDIGDHLHQYGDIYWSENNGQGTVGSNLAGATEWDGDNSGIEMMRYTKSPSKNDTGHTACSETRPINVAVNYLIKY